MNKEIEKKLLLLRNDMLVKAVEESEIQKVLIKYYPKGTTVTIDKDKWKINEPNE